MKVLITGSKGFIGKKLNFGIPYTGRLSQISKLYKESENMQGIVHLAAISNKRLCESSPKKCIDSNLVGLCNILEVALKRKIWVLFVSTYQIKERHLYGLTKLLGEELCRIYQSKGLKVSILRLPIVYGENDKSDKVVPKIISEIKKGIKPKIYTSQAFYFLYVNDVAKLIENEVRVLCGKSEKPYTLTQLIDGIQHVYKAKK